MRLVWPSAEYLPAYAEALRRGWSPDNLRPEVAAEELAWIERDPAGFLASQVDLDGRRPPHVLPDGSMGPRIVSYSRWLWDGELCGGIDVRWQRGTPQLPPYVLGHIGYAVVPWKRGRGYATRALRMLLDEIRDEGLPYVELTTDEANLASRRVIEANGGTVIEHFHKPPHLGGAPSVRYRISLP